MFTFKKFALISVALVAALSMSCTEETEDPGEDGDLVRKSFTLSNAGASYGDLDAAKTYKQADLATAAGDIDLVAYYTSGASKDILNPCYVPTIGEDCGFPELYSIPSKYHAALVSATKTSEIVDFLNGFAAEEFGVDEEDEISISKDKAFLVFSTNEKFYVVVITADGAQTVSLDFFNTPE